MIRRLASLIDRVWNTAVFWTWMFNGLRFAAGLLLMPLLLRLLSQADLGLYSLFFQFTAFLVTFDQMFAVTMARFAGYALRGVTELKPVGITTIENDNSPPNIELLGQLLGVARRQYRLLSLGIFVLLGIFGTLLLLPDFQKASSPRVAYAAWAITVLSACLELYTGYAVAFLRGLNNMLLSARLSTFIYGFRLVLAIALLIARLNLLAVPIATLVTALLQRYLSRRLLRANLPPGVRFDSSGYKEIMRKVWPSAWRLGAILVSVNVMTVGFGLIISRKWGVESVGPYHFSQQILISVCVSMASVWTFVKWPIICQQRAENNFVALRRLVWQRLWLQLITYVVLASFFIVLGPPLLKWIAPDKQFLPWPWLLLLALYAFLEMHYGFWTTLISTENRIPSVWAAMITNLSTLILAFLLATYTTLGWGAFVISPLLCGLIFNYWFWPRIGAQGMGTTWLDFMLHPPSRTSSDSPSSTGRAIPA